MFVKIISLGEVESIAIYECDKIYITAYKNRLEHPEEYSGEGKMEDLKFVELQRFESGFGSVPTTREIIVETGKVRLFVMNNKGETIDRIYG